MLSELCLQHLVNEVIAASAFEILSVMCRSGFPSCEMIIPTYLAFSTTLTGFGVPSGCGVKWTSSSLCMRISLHFSVVEFKVEL